MKVRNNYLISAGVICLFTAILHTIGGQIDLVNPLMESDLKLQTKSELLGVWHMVTVILFISAYVLLKNGMNVKDNELESVKLIARLFLLFGLVFIVVCLYKNVLAPQWVLCLPIAVLTFVGLNKMKLGDLR